MKRLSEHVVDRVFDFILIAYESIMRSRHEVMATGFAVCSLRPLMKAFQPCRSRAACATHTGCFQLNLLKLVRIRLQYPLSRLR